MPFLSNWRPFCEEDILPIIYPERELKGKFSCPLTWWKNHISLYPKLANLARIVLAISVAGQVVTAKRNSLKGNTVATLVYLHAVFAPMEYISIIDKSKSSK